MFSLPALLIVSSPVVPGFALAGSGFSVSREIGVNVAAGPDTTGFSNDRATAWDEFITRISGKFRKPSQTARDLVTAWVTNRKNDFDGATGILFGAAACLNGNP